MNLTTSSFRYQINVVVTVTLLASSIVIMTFVLLFSTNMWEESEKKDGIKITENFATDNNILLALIYNSKDNAEISTTSTLGFPNVIHTSVYKPNGEVLIQKGKEINGWIPIDSFGQLQFIVKDNRDFWQFWSPVYVEQRSFPNSNISPDTSKSAVTKEILGYVHVAIEKAPIYRFRNEMLQNLSLIISLETILILTLVYFATRKITTPIQQLSHIMDTTKLKFDWHPQTPYGSSEVVKMWHSFNNMMYKITEQEHYLEEEVARKTKDLEKARDEALRYTEENRILIKELNQKLEAERKYLAAEIHDQINSIITATRLDINSAIRLLNMNHTENLPKIHKLFENIKVKISAVYDVSRGIIERLRPEVISSLGLEGALEELIRAYRKNNFKLELIITSGLPPLNDEFNITLYRIVQECINNIFKHSGASYAVVQISLETINNTSYIKLTVKDNGSGFESEKIVGKGVGIIGMRERAISMNGTFNITSNGGGTIVEVVIPLDVE